MDQCVRNFKYTTGCSTSEALLAASLHPAQVLQLDRGGKLEPGSWADMVILNQDLYVQATCIAGEIVWTLPGSSMHTEWSKYTATRSSQLT